jgi:transposase
VRRRFDAEYKARILREADQVTEPGQLGALLRREGLYASHLSVWRKQRDGAAIAGLGPKRRGRKPDPNAVLVAENQRLVRENAKLMKKLRRTEAILEVQNKLSETLGIELPCSIRTMDRVLEANQQVRERRNQLRHPADAKPQLMATPATRSGSSEDFRCRSSRLPRSGSTRQKTSRKSAH